LRSSVQRKFIDEEKIFDEFCGAKIEENQGGGFSTFIVFIWFKYSVFTLSPNVFIRNASSLAPVFQNGATP